MAFCDRHEGWTVTEAFLKDYHLIGNKPPSHSYGRVLHTEEVGRTWQSVHKGASLGSLARHEDVLMATGMALLRSEGGVE